LVLAAPGGALLIRAPGKAFHLDDLAPMKAARGQLAPVARLARKADNPRVEKEVA